MKRVCIVFILLLVLMTVCFAEGDIAIYLDGTPLDEETLGYVAGDSFWLPFEGLEGVKLLYDNSIQLDKDTVIIFNSPLVSFYEDKISFKVLGQNLKDDESYMLGYVINIIEAKDSKSSISIQTVTINKKGVDFYIEVNEEKEKVDVKVNNNLFFVNRNNPLPKEYKPKELVKINSSIIPAYSSDSRLLNRTAADALYEMIKAAKDDGVKDFIIESSYRSYDKQKSIFQYRLSINEKLGVKKPLEETQKRVALPGTSEHHTGLCVDIVTGTAKSERKFGSTKQAQWLKDNCYKFGFIVRYPEDKQKETYTIYEPWHIRYVGKLHAKLLKDRNLCMEEYMAYLKKNRVMSYYDQGEDKWYAVCFMPKLGDIYFSKGSKHGFEISEAGNASYIFTIRLQ